MSCHSRHGYKAATRVAARLTGLPRDQVEAQLHSLRAEASGLTLSDPTQDQIDEWYRATLNEIHNSELSDDVKVSLGISLRRARYEDPPPTGRDLYVQERLLARCRQQAVVASAPGLTALAPPGSQADQYPRDEYGRPAEVWYASYGSNLHRDRFMNYIQGGQPQGGARTYSGARDKTPPSADIPVALPGTIHYAGRSLVWDGGVAFLDSETAGTSLGRAYKITASQFDDVVAQESQSEPDPERRVDTARVVKEGRLVTPGLYGTLVHVGDYEGRPVVTFTGAFTTGEALRGDLVATAETGELAFAADREVPQRKQLAAQMAENAVAQFYGKKPDTIKKDWPVFSSPPSPEYQTMIANGLRETFGLSDGQIRDYFGGSTGVLPNLNA